MPVSVAVGGNYIYWTDFSSDNRIGRASLDGTGVNPSFIDCSASPGDTMPFAITISGSYIYWTNYVWKVTGGGTIGRAKLDGTGANQSFLGGDLADFNPGWIAIAGGYMYWSEPGDALSPGKGTIERAKLDGTELTRNFIAGAFTPIGLVVGP
jgi:hypothetical protein